MVSRRVVVGLLGVLAVPLTAASLAWACVPRGAVTVDPTSAPSGSTVSVALTGFPNTPVDVRWNGLSGPRLGGGVGPAFTVDVTVPAVTAGSYVISAATVDEHASHSEGRVAFEVTGSGNSATAPTPAPGSNSNPPPLNPFAPQPSGGGKVITGTARGDRLIGTSGRDVIRCGGGNDVVSAGGGNDYIDCGAGNDRVNGGSGNDEIRGGSGHDTLSGGSGNDEIRGGSGHDTLSGGSGNDEMFGASGNDKLSGGLGADELSGGLGVDTLRGNGGRDRLSGGSGRDILYADRVDRLVLGKGDRVRRSPPTRAR